MREYQKWITPENEVLVQYGGRVCVVSTFTPHGKKRAFYLYPDGGRVQVFFDVANAIIRAASGENE